MSSSRTGPSAAATSRVQRPAVHLLFGRRGQGGQDGLEPGQEDGVGALELPLRPAAERHGIGGGGGQRKAVLQPELDIVRQQIRGRDQADVPEPFVQELVALGPRLRLQILLVAVPLVGLPVVWVRSSKSPKSFAGSSGAITMPGRVGGPTRKTLRSSGGRPGAASNTTSLGER